MYFTEPEGDGPSVAAPSMLTAATIGVGVLVTLGLGVVPGPCSTWPGWRESSSGDHQPVLGGARAPGRRRRPRRPPPQRLLVVEEALAGHVVSRTPYVTEAASHLLVAGGKRFRPLLVLLAAETGDTPTPRPSSTRRASSS